MFYNAVLSYKMISLCNFLYQIRHRNQSVRQPHSGVRLLWR